MTLPPNRTPGTIAAYRRRAEQLRDRVARIRGQNPADLLPIHIVEHVLSRGFASESDQSGANHRQPSKSAFAGESRSGAASGRHAGESQGPDGVISKATFRQYKAALLVDFELQLEAAQTRYDAEVLRVAIDRLLTASQTPFARRGAAGSALKAKTFKEAEYTAVLKAVAAGIECGHQWAVALNTFLQANRIAGLRPSEWEHASIRHASPDSDALVLIVRNAKTTNGRGNGESRTLLLDGLCSDDMAALHEMVQLVDDIQTGRILGLDVRPAGLAKSRKTGLPAYRRISYPELHKLLRDYLRRLTREIWPPTGRRRYWPTLYSLRHQVAADAKASGSSKAEVAALLGHGSDATAGLHYGRRRSGGKDALKVRPVAEEVATVRSKSRPYPKDRFPTSPGRGKP